MIKSAINTLLILAATVFSAYTTAGTVLTGGNITVTEAVNGTGSGVYNVDNGSNLTLFSFAVSNNTTTAVSSNGATASDGAFIFWEANIIDINTWNTFDIQDPFAGFVPLTTFGAFTDYFDAADSVNIYWAAESQLINAGASVSDAFLFSPAILQSAGVAFAFDSLTDTSSGIALTSAVPVPAAVWLMGSGLLGLIGVARRRKIA